jgi:hypothetical protein
MVKSVGRILPNGPAIKCRKRCVAIEGWEQKIRIRAEWLFQPEGAKHGALFAVMAQILL